MEYRRVVILEAKWHTVPPLLKEPRDKLFTRIRVALFRATVNLLESSPIRLLEVERLGALRARSA